MTNIFVFGSNLSGIHGAGSAKEAYINHGAVWGQGVGHHGNSYAIPTRDRSINTSLELSEVKYYVEEFLDYARARQDLHFRVVKIGCGLAGFKEYEIAPLFSNVPENVHLPAGW